MEGTGVGEMTATAACAMAMRAHAGQRTAYGEPLIHHLERVAARVSSDAAAVAWLHDMGERDAASVHELRANGITTVELAALELLTRTELEDYGLYIRRIARARGPAGTLARIVKLAELSDHLARLPASSPAAERYRRARDQIELARRRTQRRLIARLPGPAAEAPR